MSELPVVEPSAIRSHDPLRARRLVIHSLRVALFLCILLMIRFKGQQNDFSVDALDIDPTAIQFVQAVFPLATSIGESEGAQQVNVITDQEGAQLGYVLQTSPMSNHIIGYSGPTNCLVILDRDNRIRRIEILASGDTVEHIDQIKEDPEFLDSFRGLGFETEDAWRDLDAVSGATLSSYAIIGAVANRVGGSAPDLKFRSKPQVENVRLLFPAANRIEASSQTGSWSVHDPSGGKIGTVITTTPVADHLAGYQGPTATLIGLDMDGRCTGLAVDQTYDNDPYARYLNDDYSFLGFYTGKRLEELAELDPEKHEIDGVSGATMTTQAVAKAIPLVAKWQLENQQPSALPPKSSANVSQVATRSLLSYWADGVTILLTIIGLAFSFSRLKHWKRVRIGFQIVLIVVLGFYSGHLVSQAQLAGWASHGVAWRVAPGLACLTLAALLVPIFSKQQTYCQHLCPLGAIQQLTRNRLPWRFKLPRWLALIPGMLLIAVVAISVIGIPFNLASLEPFDGFAFRVSGWASISILVVGVAVSLFTPMAFCRFGCPTGLMLNFLKFRGDSYQLGLKDFVAGGLAVLGFVMMSWL
ncbi:MAG: FMN-binding protein [Planctomycetota bacterium]